MTCTACHTNTAVQNDLCGSCFNLSAKLAKHPHPSRAVPTVPVFVGGVAVARRCTGCHANLDLIFRTGVRISASDLTR